VPTAGFVVTGKASSTEGTVYVCVCQLNASYMCLRCIVKLKTNTLVAEYQVIYLFIYLYRRFFHDAVLTLGELVVN